VCTHARRLCQVRCRVNTRVSVPISVRLSFIKALWQGGHTRPQAMLVLKCRSSAPQQQHHGCDIPRVWCIHIHMCRAATRLVGRATISLTTEAHAARPAATIPTTVEPLQGERSARWPRQRARAAARLTCSAPLVAVHRGPKAGSRRAGAGRCPLCRASRR